MITLASQQYGTAETEIMIEGETHRGTKRQNEECRLNALTLRKLSSEYRDLGNGENWGMLG